MHCFKKNYNLVFGFDNNGKTQWQCDAKNMLLIFLIIVIIIKKNLFLIKVSFNNKISLLLFFHPKCLQCRNHA